MKKQLLSILLSVGLLTSCVANAMVENIDCQNDTNGKTLITGSAEAGETVTVRIFKKKNHLDSDGKFSYSKAQSDILVAAYDDNLQSVLAFADQTVADESGKFSFNVKISNLLDSNGAVSTDAISDIYVVAVSPADGLFPEFLFVDPLERVAKYRELSGMKNSASADVKKFLDNYKYALGIYAPIYNDLDSDNVYDILYNYLSDEHFDVADQDDSGVNETKNIAAMNDMLKLLVIEALNQSEVDTVKNYENELMLKNTDIYTWYSKKLVDDKFKSALTTRLSGKYFDDISEFDNALTEAVVLQWIASSDGIDDCMSIIGDFKTEIGYTEDAVIAEDAVRGTMGTSFDTYSALKGAIDGYDSGDDSDDDSDTTSTRRPGKGGGSFGGTTLPVTPVETPQAINAYFNDLSDSAWAVEAINYLAENKVLAGKAEGVFAPNDNVTRAEFAKILVTAFGLNTKADIAFNDVPADSWYCEFVKTAVGSGIAKGTSESTFGPEENITRQDMAVMLMNAARIAGKLAETSGNLNFPDEAEISDYAKAAVNTLSKAGIINGMGDGTFAPKAFATRAQAAKLVHGLLTY